MTTRPAPALLELIDWLADGVRNATSTEQLLDAIDDLIEVVAGSELGGRRFRGAADRPERAFDLAFADRDQPTALSA